MYYHGADVVVVVYDITDWDSLTVAKTWLNGKISHNDYSRNTKLLFSLSCLMIATESLISKEKFLLPVYTKFTNCLASQ